MDQFENEKNFSGATGDDPLSIAKYIYALLKRIIYVTKTSYKPEKNYSSKNFQEASELVGELFQEFKDFIHLFQGNEVYNCIRFWELVDISYKRAEKYGANIDFEPSVNDFLLKAALLAAEDPVFGRKLLCGLNDVSTHGFFTADKYRDMYFDVSIHSRGSHSLISGVHLLPESIVTDEEIISFSKSDYVDVLGIQCQGRYALSFLNMALAKKDELTQKRKIETFVFLCLNRHDAHSARSIYRFLETHILPDQEDLASTERNAINVCLSDIRNLIEKIGCGTIPKKVGGVSRYYFTSESTLKMRIVLRSSMYSLVSALMR